MRHSLDDVFKSRISNSIAADVQALDEAEIVDDQLAGQGSDEVVSDFELTEIFEGTDARKLADQILVFEVFVTQLDCSAVSVQFNVTPLVDLGKGLEFFRIVDLGKRSLAGEAEKRCLC
jgi:hypothetical protein